MSSGQTTIYITLIPKVLTLLYIALQAAIVLYIEKREPYNNNERRFTPGAGSKPKTGGMGHHVLVYNDDFPMDRGSTGQRAAAMYVQRYIIYANSCFVGSHLNCFLFHLICTEIL